MHVADCAGIPRGVMTYLVQDDLVRMVDDIRLILVDDVAAIRQTYTEKYTEDQEKLHLWTFKMSMSFKYMIEWFN